jgi:hypothetical protein
VSNTISGSCGVASAVVNLSGAGTTQTTTADGSGNFSFTVTANGVYVVTPLLSGSAFTPTNQSVTMASSNISGVDFTPLSNVVGFSPTDSRSVSPNLNKGAVQSDGSVFYTTETSPSNSTVPGTDSRAAGAPVDSRASKPTNSRAS